MAFTRTSLLAPLAITLAIVLTPMITACGGNPIQNIIKGATGGQVDVGGTNIPADFPTEVPLTSGHVVSTTSFGNLEEGKVWNVAIKVSDGTAIDGIANQLTDAGFKLLGESLTLEAGAANIFTKDPYSVMVIIAKDDKLGTLANYTVTWIKSDS
ncbi:MAG: hypothetical protein ABIW32_00935 [Terrimesophilobacter sp.]